MSYQTIWKYNYPDKSIIAEDLANGIKPYVTVSAKGIANGLSDIPNDGADFGPDTMLNATDPSQIGSPYTQTSGIQEAVNYVLNSPLFSNGLPKIFLLQGNFIINDNATIWINNNPNSPPLNSPNGLYICGVSPALSVITKQNSLPSPIISFTNPNGYTPTGSLIGNTIFENFTVYYSGPASNATSGVTLANLSIPEQGGSLAVFKNLYAIAWDVNNTMLDISGHEDSIAEGLYVWNTGTGYNASITTPALKVNVVGGMINLYNIMVSGIDISVQNGSIINSTIGTSGGQGIVFRPSYNGSILNLQNTSFNGTLTRLITISPTTSGTTNSGQINLTNAWLSKTPTGNGDYMIETNANIPIIWNFAETTFWNNNTSYTLYLFDPNISTNDEYLNLYTHTMGNHGVILKTENSTSGTTAGAVSMKFITYLSIYKKLMIYLSGYENNTTTNQTINYPLPFSTSAIITGNNTGLTISASTTGITITSPNSTTAYSGIVIVEGY